jgi:hypothetical protein
MYSKAYYYFGKTFTSMYYTNKSIALSVSELRTDSPKWDLNERKLFYPYLISGLENPVRLS